MFYAEKNWKKLYFFHQAFTIGNSYKLTYRVAWQMTFGSIYVDLMWETIHLRFLLTVVRLLSIAQYSRRKASTGFQPFHVTKVGNFRTEKQQALDIRVLINRQHFKTGVLEIPIRESFLSHAFHIPPSYPFSFVCNPSSSSFSSTSFIAS